MTRKLLLLPLSLLFFTYALMGQTDTSDTDVFGGFFIMPIEVPFISSDAFDQQLLDNGFPRLNIPRVAFGGGFMFYTNRLITSFSFNRKTVEKEEDGFLTEVEYRSTSISFGYDLTKNYKRHFYPFVGFKGYGLNYIYKEKIPDGTSFQNFLVIPNSFKELNYTRANLDLGFGMAFQKIFYFNIKGGYLLPLQKPKWTVNNTQDALSNSPALDYPFYFTFTVGLGGVEKEEEFTPLEERRERRNRSVLNNLQKKPSFARKTKKS